MGLSKETLSSRAHLLIYPSHEKIRPTTIFGGRPLTDPVSRRPSPCRVLPLCTKRGSVTLGSEDAPPRGIANRRVIGPLTPGPACPTFRPPGLLRAPPGKGAISIKTRGTASSAPIDLRSKQVGQDLRLRGSAPAPIYPLSRAHLLRTITFP